MLTAAMAGESVPAETLRVPRTSWLRRVLSDEALTWSVSRRFAFAAVVVPFVVAGVAIATMPSASAFAWLTSENAPLELSQFVLVAAAAVLFGVLSLILRRRSLGWALLYAIVSLAALVVAGEVLFLELLKALVHVAVGDLDPEALGLLLVLLALRQDLGANIS